MNVLEALAKRRTFRSYVKDYMPPKDVIEAITNAALDSPSALNYQGLDLIVITNKEKINAITQKSLSSWPQETQNKFGARREWGCENVVTCDAPILYLLVKNENAHDTFIQIDSGIMCMSIMVAAMNFGLGSMCVGSLLWGDVAGVEKEAGIPQGSLAMAVVVGKLPEHPKAIEKTRKCKATYIE